MSPSPSPSSTSSPFSGWLSPKSPLLWLWLANSNPLGISPEQLKGLVGKGYEDKSHDYCFIMTALQDRLSWKDTYYFVLHYLQLAIAMALVYLDFANPSKLGIWWLIKMIVVHCWVVLYHLMLLCRPEIVFPLPKGFNCIGSNLYPFWLDCTISRWSFFEHSFYSLMLIMVSPLGVVCRLLMCTYCILFVLIWILNGSRFKEMVKTLNAWEASIMHSQSKEALRKDIYK